MSIDIRYTYFRCPPKFGVPAAETEVSPKVSWLLSAETESMPKVLQSTSSASKPKFGRSLIDDTIDLQYSREDNCPCLPTSTPAVDWCGEIDSAGDAENMFAGIVGYTTVDVEYVLVFTKIHSAYCMLYHIFALGMQL